VSSPSGSGRAVSSGLRVAILAGGRGERFWPFSRRARPKPFLDLGWGRSLLQETIRRAALVALPGNIWIIAGRELLPLVRRETRRGATGRCLMEPASRNTGPTALLAARLFAAEDPAAEMLTLPSDHRVTNDRAFRRAIGTARRLARRGFLVTFGVPPTGPDPEFGYLVPGARLGGTAMKVARFIEKPRRVLAMRLIQKRAALWNSGMFLWRADSFLEEASRCQPAFGRWLALGRGGARLSPAEETAFRSLPALSVDHAVLEKSRRVAVVPARFGWADLGAWSSIGALFPPDRAGNAGWGKRVAIEARGNLAFHPKGLTAFLGVSDLLVACVGDVVLVCPRSQSGRIRELVRLLRATGNHEYL